MTSIKVAVLGSTRGTDLQAIIDANLPGIEISLVISDKSDAYILERAKNHNLNTMFLDPKHDGKKIPRKEYDAMIDKQLENYNIDLVLLIGYMRLFSDEFVDEWRNRVMNIHPSLLPAFAGGMDRNVHADVLARGCKVSGASLIFIDEGADTGPIIDQRTVSVTSDETIDSLKAKVQKLEGEMLVDALCWYRDGRIKVADGIVTVEP